MFSESFGSGKNEPVRKPAFVEFSQKAIDDLSISDEAIESHLINRIQAT